MTSIPPPGLARRHDALASHGLWSVLGSPTQERQRRWPHRLNPTPPRHVPRPGVAMTGIDIVDNVENHGGSC